MSQDVIDIDNDGLHAKARFRVTMQMGLHESATCLDPNHRDHVPRQFLEGALYEVSDSICMPLTFSERVYQRGWRLENTHIEVSSTMACNL